MWLSRWIVLVPVVVSILLALGLVYIATADAINVLLHLGTYVGETASQSPSRGYLIGKIVKIADVYLLAAFMFVFAFGLFVLFIGNVDMGEESATASRLLTIDSLDTLKGRLGEVALLILIVEFVQIAFELVYTRTLDLLYLAIGILLVAVALAVSVRPRH
jgi:uncharacterized membrane protein YqhA